jgi:hypothetical protein
MDLPGVEARAMRMKRWRVKPLGRKQAILLGPNDFQVARVGAPRIDRHRLIPRQVTPAT